MKVRAGFAGVADNPPTARVEEFDLDCLPKNLSAQCRWLIENYHEVHGSACLPDVLWRSGYGPFIERHRELRFLLRKASTTRSAKKCHSGFVRIATTILSLEILASNFAGWSAIYPAAGEAARALLKWNARGPHMPLMEFYLYPSKYISSVAVAPDPNRSGDAELYRVSKPELSGAKQALNYLVQKLNEKVR